MVDSLGTRADFLLIYIQEAHAVNTWPFGLKNSFEVGEERLDTDNL